MKKKPSVHIVTLQDVVDASTPENFQRLTIDLALWLRVNVGMKAAGVEVKGASMRWTDDGINEITGVMFERSTPSKRKKP